METADILAQLQRATGKFPRAAIEGALARKDEITPELLRILEDTVNRARELVADGGYMAHIYAMFLLAQFREERAYPLLVRFASLPGDIVDSLCGEILTEDFGRLLASVSGGDPVGIRFIIENDEADEWVRGTALNGLLSLFAEEKLSRETVLGYFAQLFQGGLRREPSEVWNSLVASSSDLYCIDLMNDIELAYRDGLVDPGNISMDDVRHDLRLGAARVLARTKSDRHHHMVRDIIKEMEWWACFNRRESNTTKVESEAIPSPVRQPQLKVGRNEPCPCGSGKKYKKCCGV